MTADDIRGREVKVTQYNIDYSEWLNDVRNYSFTVPNDARMSIMYWKEDRMTFFPIDNYEFREVRFIFKDGMDLVSTEKTWVLGSYISFHIRQGDTIENSMLITNAEDFDFCDMTNIVAMATDNEKMRVDIQRVVITISPDHADAITPTPAATPTIDCIDTSNTIIGQVRDWLKSFFVTEPVDDSTAAVEVELS